MHGKDEEETEAQRKQTPSSVVCRRLGQTILETGVLTKGAQLPWALSFPGLPTKHLLPWLWATQNPRSLFLRGRRPPEPASAAAREPSVVTAPSPEASVFAPAPHSPLPPGRTGAAPSFPFTVALGGRGEKAKQTKDKEPVTWLQDGFEVSLTGPHSFEALQKAKGTERVLEPAIWAS